MKMFTALACFLFMSMPVLGSALSDSETIEEAYDIPVTIGVSGMMVTNQSKTSKVMLSHPNGSEIIVFNVSSQQECTKLPYNNVASLSSEDLGGAFYVYYPSDYILQDKENKKRFRTKIIIPEAPQGEKIEKILLHARTFYSDQSLEWIGEGYAELITSKAQ